MFCKNCGNNVENAAFCSVCGASCQAEAAASKPLTATPAAPKLSGGAKAMGIIGMIISILGALLSIVCCIFPVYNLVLIFIGIVSLVLSIIGVVLAKKQGCKNPMAVVGLILSIVVVVVPLIYDVFAVIAGVIGGIASTAAGY